MSLTEQQIKTLQPIERAQFEKNGITIYPSTMSDAQAANISKTEHRLVFRESVSTPGDLTVFAPGQTKHRLSDLKRDYSQQAGDDFKSEEDIVSSLCRVFKLPVHSQRTIEDNIRKTIHVHNEQGKFNEYGDVTKDTVMNLAKQNNALVFTQAQSTDYGPYDIYIYSPSATKRSSLEFQIAQHPDKFINLKNVSQEIGDILGHPPHELLNPIGAGLPPIIVRNPILPPLASTTNVAPTAMLIDTNKLPSVEYKQRLHPKTSGLGEELRTSGVVLSKDAITREDALLMAQTTRCCVFRESDSVPGEITIFSPSEGQLRLSQLSSDTMEALTTNLKKLTGFVGITKDEIETYNSAKSFKI